MEFVLLGFDQSNSIREFRFESISADHCRAPVVVTADLALAREYGIQLQNLPLLCRDLLLHAEPVSLAAGLITLTANDMAASQMAAKARTEQKHPHGVRRGLPSNVGKTSGVPRTFGPA